ncbi:ribokinase [Shimia biformata]|uniref:ribokinase n=1 Tax=Shimia biformata TaxID=1294299 RepID=UPI00195132FC|nr:ribokinase [Shimia biformata]
MTIFNLGSINADIVYRLPHLPGPGETLAATELTRGLGGKGANMSVAAARAAARVAHIGAVGEDGRWAVQRLTEYGVDTRHITAVGDATGHAIIAVDDAGENSIILYPGANHAISEAAVCLALAEAAPGDTLVLQNETNLQGFTARTAREQGLRVAYAAAPFDADAVMAVLPFLDFLILNAVEARQLQEATGKSPNALGVANVVITLGAQGCRWLAAGADPVEIPALPVEVVDSTGAGDTFTGYTLAALDRGMPMEQALRLATKAAAIMVTRLGTADVIPDLKEVQSAEI